MGNPHAKTYINITLHIQQWWLISLYELTSYAQIIKGRKTRDGKSCIQRTHESVWHLVGENMPDWGTVAVHGTDPIQPHISTG
ncbi:hypothetical protein XENOCAPTIV_024947 [Xenoophorus captivus]|uniref:Uncharacterized protein n=1 Tax=Xenoophorus captivus TaxID=1517983 RepID=A0ABV0QFI9_9TELE